MKILLALLLIALFFATPFVYNYFRSRKNLIFTTKHGTRIYSTLKLDQSQFDMISNIIDDTVSFWKNSQFGYLTTGLEDVIIEIGDKVLEYDVNGEKLTFWGVQKYNDIEVILNDMAPFNITLSLIKHEISHYILQRNGVDPGFIGNDHHKIFSDVGLFAKSKVK
jgi:hypothetical protein